MVFSILQTFLGLAVISTGDSMVWKPATPFCFLQDSTGKIVRFEPEPEWTPAPKNPGNVASAVLGKPQRP